MRVLAEPTPQEVFGPDVPAPMVELRAGPVSVWFDRQWVSLRRFRIGSREALRAIYPAVRTNTWKTVAPLVKKVRIDSSADRFRITFEARHVVGAGADFVWRGELTGEPDGTVTYRFDGRARSAFESNRTGLCVLHPSLECAGRRVAVEHVDGRTTRSVFPDTVSPHQPFFDIRSLTHEVAPGLPVRVTMEGEAFEMEDQRNWTDASFKTYGGALSRGLPLRFSAGQRVRQTARFEVLETPPARLRRLPVQPTRLRLPTAATTALPSIGTRWAPEPGPLEAQDVERLRSLRFGHFVIDADVTSENWREVVARALTEVAALDAKIWVRLTMTPNHQPAVRQLASALEGHARRLLAVSVSSRVEPCPGAVTLSLVRPLFAKIAPRVPLASSPLNDFADLNRFRPPVDAVCAVPMSPQVHTFDLESMIENLQSQASVLATVRSFNPHPIMVGPVSLGRRREPDPRQRSIFCAAWTAGSLAWVLPTGLAHAVAYHEHAGANGILATPTEDLFAGFAGAVGCAPVKGHDPKQLAALALFDRKGTRRLLVANLTRETVEISVAGAGDTFEFGPYATAWLEA